MNRQRRGAIAWMASNPVAANLLMILCIGGGLVMSFQVKQEVFPRFELDEVRVSFAYPGASPEEIEQGVLLAAEETVRGLDGVKEVVSAANESSGIVRVKLLRNADLEQALSDVKGAIDRIRSMPEEVERPIIKLTQAKQLAITVLVHGQVSPETLREHAESLRRQLIANTPVTMAEVSGVSAREVAIEVRPEKLRMYGLTVPQIARFVRNASIELPSGRIRSASGEILVRTTQRRNLGREFADIVILSRPDGTRVRLSDVADVKDGFAEDDEETSFNGEPTVSVNVIESEIKHRTKSRCGQGIPQKQWQFQAFQPPPGATAQSCLPIVSICYRPMRLQVSFSCLSYWASFWSCGFRSGLCSVFYLISGRLLAAPDVRCIHQHGIHVRVHSRPWYRGG